MKESLSYQQLDDLRSVASFSDYLDRIEGVATALFGSGDYGVMTCHLREHRPVLEGSAAQNPLFQRIAVGSEKACKAGAFAQSEGNGPTKQEMKDAISHLLADELADSDRAVKVARLCKGEFFSAFLIGIKSDAVFSELESERFEHLGLFSEQLIGRMSLIQYDKEIRRQLFAFRAECPAAYFQYDSKNGLVPMNHQAVEYSEKHWDQDVPALMLNEADISRVEAVMATSWISPVEAFWAAMELDMGGGNAEVYVIPRAQGDAIVMLQTRPKREALAKASDYLTKRQEEIMEWIAEGKTSGEVAVILDISPRTVEKHLEAIFQRLGVENRITAMRRYLELKGLIEA